MTWAPGYVKENYTEYPSTEEASAALSNITSTAPNRGQLVSSTAVPYPSNRVQQGTAILSTAPTIAGCPSVTFYAWGGS